MNTELTIQQVIDRGWVECNSNDACAAILKVEKDGTVEQCGWGCFEYWNLFISQVECHLWHGR